MTGPANRSQLQQIINGLSEGVILIETDQTIAYANEAALALHGVSRLEDLGCDVTTYRKNFVPRYRNHHPPGAAHSPVERVVGGEAFHDVVVEVAPAGADKPQWVHRIRSLVISDAHGLPDCLVLIIHDETERYEAEERFERAFSANPAPAAICRLSDLRIARVNQGFLEFTGFQRDEVQGRSIYEVDLLRKAQRRELAIERLNAGRTIPQMEAWLQVPSDPERWVIVSGQPIEMPGDEPCMLFTFADLEARRQAEEALQHSQEHLAKAFELSPVPTLLGERAGFRLLEVNRAFVDTFGFEPEAVRGQSPGEIGLWADPTLQQEFERTLKRKGSVRGFEGRLRTKAGDEYDVLISAETVTFGRESRVLCTLQDISERVRSETELVRAIEAAVTDATWFSRGVLEKLATLRGGPRVQALPEGLASLTAREREILAAVGNGGTDAEIGEALSLARYTVRNHVAALYRKLGVSRRSALVVLARDQVLSSPNPGPRRKRRKSGSTEP